MTLKLTVYLIKIMKQIISFILICFAGIYTVNAETNKTDSTDIRQRRVKLLHDIEQRESYLLDKPNNKDSLKAQINAYKELWIFTDEALESANSKNKFLEEQLDTIKSQCEQYRKRLDILEPLTSESTDVLIMTEFPKEKDVPYSLLGHYKTLIVLRNLLSEMAKVDDDVIEFQKRNLSKENIAIIIAPELDKIFSGLSDLSKDQLTTLSSEQKLYLQENLTEKYKKYKTTYTATNK